MKTRFLDIDNGTEKPQAVVEKEAQLSEEQKVHEELALLYYEQWVDTEMWKEFTIDEADQIQD